MNNNMSRRSFTKLGALGAVLGAGTVFGAPAVQDSKSKHKIIGANDKIRCAFVGVGTRGFQLLDRVKTIDKIEISAFSDADTALMDKAAEKFNAKGRKEKDFRKFLDKEAGIDTMVIATPNHWHGFQVLESLKALKDVYIEKPMTNTVREGRYIIETVRRNQNIVQVGIQHRSSPLYQKIINDRIFWRVGNIISAHTAYCDNMSPYGIGREQFIDPPATLDWNLWMGPVYQPFQKNIAPAKFRWWVEFVNPFATQAIHLLDMIRWIYRERGPASVSAYSNKLGFRDDRTVPTTVEAVMRFPSGRLVSLSCHEASGNPRMGTDEKYEALGDIELRGNLSTLYFNDNRFVVKKERIGSFQPKDTWRRNNEIFELKEEEKKIDATKAHLEDFFNCVRSREKNRMPADEGYYTDTMFHMIAASLITGTSLDWDFGRERFANHIAANELLEYEYYPPWKLEP